MILLVFINFLLFLHLRIEMCENSSILKFLEIASACNSEQTLNNMKDLG